MRLFSLFAFLTLLANACSGGSSGDAPAATATVRSETTPVAASDQSPASPAPTTTVPPATETLEATATTAAAPTATAPPAPTTPPAPTAPPAPTSPPAPAGVPAPIQGFGFPYQLTVAAGSTVVWTNNDAAPHDVTAKDKSWTSGLIAQGESYSRTFDVAGTYAYVCEVHPYMTAALIVE